MVGTNLANILQFICEHVEKKMTDFFLKLSPKINDKTLFQTILTFPSQHQNAK